MPNIILRPRQDGRHFQDDICICIFLNGNEWHSIKISLKFVPKVPISNIPALVQIMAWRRPGDKPLSEPMMVFSPTHICVTRPQWDIVSRNIFMAVDILWWFFYLDYFTKTPPHLVTARHILRFCFCWQWGNFTIDRNIISRDVLLNYTASMKEMAWYVNLMSIGNFSQCEVHLPKHYASADR